MLKLLAILPFVLLACDPEENSIEPRWLENTAIHLELESPIDLLAAWGCFDQHPALVLYNDETIDGGDDEVSMRIELKTSGHEDRAFCLRAYLLKLGGVELP